MPRHARQVSRTGFYHLIVRGINRRALFNDDEDHQRYWETLARITEDNSIAVLGYCLMDNQAHLLLQEDSNGVSNIIGIAWMPAMPIATTGNTNAPVIFLKKVLQNSQKGKLIKTAKADKNR